MSAINLPYNIQNGGPLDADQVMANLQAITAVSNGLLEADTNVLVAAPSSAILGNVNQEGTANTLPRSDHQHIIQGVENVTTLPTSGNFLGRLVYVTSGVNIGKLMMCSDAGAAVFVAFGNSAATDLVVHGAQHMDGGHDPLPDNIVTDHMKAVRGVVSTQIGADVSSISTSAYTTITTLSVTTTGPQTLLVTICVKATTRAGSSPNKPSVAIRVRDTTAANVTVFRSGSHQLGVEGGGSDSAALCYSFLYTTPAGGARTLQLQAGCDINGVDIKAVGTFNGDGTNAYPTLAAVIV